MQVITRKLTIWTETNRLFFVSSKRNYYKVYDNIMKSVKLQNKINTIFMNSENSKTSHSHRLLLNLSDNINLKKRK